ncbi:MAG TPA: ketose-bisphosphate aldolase [Allosphingosinicella sp.]|jgi:fructose-bisphosphate aldolase class II
MLQDAADRGYGIPAFNVNTAEQAYAILEAADAEKAPAILQFTLAARNHMGPRIVARLIQGLEETFPNVPLCIHQDHALDLQTCMEAVDLGFTSVMIDGSMTPDLQAASEFETNVEVTSKVVERLRPHGISVEGALGVVGSLESCLGTTEDGLALGPGIGKDDFRTDITRAQEFVRATSIDALAVAVGTNHGLAKFTSPAGTESLELCLLDRIHQRVPEVHLVMHGCSSLPAELQSIINDHGGRLGASYGVPVQVIRSAIGKGLRKINIDTDNRLAMTAGIRRYFTEHPEQIDPKVYLRAGANRVTQLCRDRFRAFGAADRAVGLAPLAPTSPFHV